MVILRVRYYRNQYYITSKSIVIQLFLQKNFMIRISWLTMSKAFWKSTIIPHVTILSSADLMALIICINASCVEYFDLNLNWSLYNTLAFFSLDKLWICPCGRPETTRQNLFFVERFHIFSTKTKNINSIHYFIRTVLREHRGSNSPCSLFIYWEQFKNKIKNTEAQISEFLRKPSLGRNLLVLIKRVYSSIYPPCNNINMMSTLCCAIVI